MIILRKFIIPDDESDSYMQLTQSSKPKLHVPMVCIYSFFFNVINHGLKPPPHLLTIYTIVKTLIVHEMLIFPEHLMRIPRTHGLNAGTPDLTLRVLILTPGTLGLTQF